MASIMRLSRKATSAMACIALLLAAGALAACGAIERQRPGTLVVRSAHLVANGTGSMLELALDCRLSGPMQDALDHGIPLTLAIDLGTGRWPHASRARRAIELRYFPLSRRYQLREVGADDVRSFATPAYLMSALGSLRLPLPAAFAELPANTPLRVSVRLDPAALPGALRLPALFEPAWRLASGDHAWAAP